MVETNPSDFWLHTKQLMMVRVTFCAPHHSHFQTLSMFLLPYNDKVNAGPHLRFCVLPTRFLNTRFLKPCVAHCSLIGRWKSWLWSLLQTIVKLCLDSYSGQLAEWGGTQNCSFWCQIRNSYIPQMEEHEPEGRILFRLGNVTYLLDVTPSNPLPHSLPPPPIVI